MLVVVIKMSVMEIDNWNSLSADCVHCKTVNTYKKHLSPALEWGAV